jgi:hypothetical protein
MMKILMCASLIDSSKEVQLYFVRHGQGMSVCIYFKCNTYSCHRLLDGMFRSMGVGNGKKWSDCGVSSHS